MSALTVPFLMPRVEEVVPDFVMLKDRLTGSSVVEERYTATQTPSSGDVYSVGGTGTKLMIVRVANQNDYIDTSTMVLSFYAKAQAGTGGVACDVALDDSVYSMIDTINVKIGGQTVEVLNNVGHLYNALVQGSMPITYYKQSGGFEGLYIYDKWNDATSTNYLNNADVDGSALLRSRWSIGNAWLTNGRYYAVPLTLLGICRLPSLFAARNFQDITLEILFKTNVLGCVWSQYANANVLTATPTVSSASTAWVNAAGQINISDVQLTYDCCRMSADYYALMDNELRMPNGSGVAYPIDTYQVQPAALPSGSSVLTTSAAISAGSLGSLGRIVVAKGTRFLKGVYGVTKQTSAETDVRFRNNSHNGNFGFASYQVIINSKRYPQLQINNSASSFQELQKAYNQLSSVAGGSIINWFNYVGQPNVRVVNSAGASTPGTAVINGATQDASVANNPRSGSILGAFPGDEAMFQNGVNLEQFLTNQPDAGGINTSTSGYQIAIEIQNNVIQATAGVTSAGVSTTAVGTMAGVNATHYVILHFTRVLTLKAGAVEILD